MRIAPRTLLACAWPAALAASIYALCGRWGFNPTDEGLVAAYTRRILDGQVPHRDFITPRPAGSALIHMVDWAVPMSLLPAGRLLSVLEVTAYTLLLSVLIFGRPLRTFGLAQHLGTASALLVNLHTFPLMSWYTQDGVLLSAGGAVLLRRADGDRVREGLGLLLLGAAAITKQSFVVMPVVGVLAVLLRAPPERRLRVGVWAAGLAALPGLAYALWVAVAGGWDDMVTQLGGPHLVWGRDLFTRGVAWPGILLVLALLVGRKRRSLAPAFAGAVAIWAVATPLIGDLAFQGGWAALVWQALVVVVILRALFEQVIDWVALFLVLLGWTVSLSYGDPLPSLVAGSLALALADRSLALAGRWNRLAVPLAAAAGVATAIVFVDARHDHVYEDRPAGELTADLSRYTDGFGGIRTNPVTAAYVRNVRNCTRRFPAKSVAVLPDNAGLYPLLHLRNPLPIDWLFPADYEGSEQRLLDSARALGARGDYLVLLQTMTAPELPRAKRLRNALRKPVPREYDRPLEEAMISALHGHHIACGSLLGVYEPARLTAGGGPAVGLG